MRISSANKDGVRRPQTRGDAQRVLKNIARPCDIHTARPPARGTPPPRRCAHLHACADEKVLCSDAAFRKVPDFKLFFFIILSLDQPYSMYSSAAVLRHGGSPVVCTVARNPQREPDTHHGPSPPYGFESRPLLFPSFFFFGTCPLLTPDAASTLLLLVCGTAAATSRPPRAP
jgi:hypothetical protein